MSRHSYEAEFDQQCRIDEARTRANCFCQTEGFQCRGGWRCPLRETESGHDIPPDASRSFSGSVKPEWRSLIDLAATFVCYLTAALCTVAFLGWVAWCIRAAWGHA